MDYTEAVEFLDRHIELGWKPGLERMERFTELMGSPHLEYPIIHVTGTNGKTTVARTASAILTALGLKVGTYTSPHLQRVEERFEVAGEVASPDAFTQAIEDIAPFVDVLEAETGERATYFELTTAAAFAFFSEVAVDVAVIEVGLGGRLDATNIVQSEVAVVTGISIEHTEYLGVSLESIGAEKLAILKPGGVLVTGELPEAVAGLASARAAEVGTEHRAFGRDFHVDDLKLAVGGWSMDVEGVHARYPGVYIPMHGRHQATNAAVAVAAVEELFGKELPDDVVREGLAAVQLIGRIEVVGHDPLIVIDGAHNPEAFAALATTLEEEFPVLEWTLVIGAMRDKEIDNMLASMEGLVSQIIATAADHERALAQGDISAAAARVLAGVPATEVASVADGVALALQSTSDVDGIVVAGSLYVVGEARTALVGPS